MKEQPNSIEKIKAYHNLKPHLTEEQNQEIIKMLGLNQIDLEKRVAGKDNEIEFILTIYLLGWVKSMVGFEEGVGKLVDTIATDLLVETIKEERILVEIKSTTDKVFKLSKKQVDEKKAFAAKQNAKLFFAIKINGFWTMYSSEYFEKENRKISIEKDYSNSSFNEIFGDRSFLFPRGMKILSIYSKSRKENLGIYNNGYGGLIKCKFEYNNKKILQVTCDSPNKIAYTIILECLHDQMSIQDQIIKPLDPDRTLIIESLTQEYTMINLSHFLLSPIMHMQNDKGVNYDFHKFYTAMIENKTEFMERRVVLAAITYLVENGYEVLEKRENEIYRFKDMIINN